MAVACPESRRIMASETSDGIPSERVGLPSQLQWFALVVRTCSEELVSRKLGNRGYEVVLPSHTELRQLCDRVKRVRKPLFPGYLFCRFDVTKRLPILMTTGVIAIVGHGSGPIPVADSEIDSIAILGDSSCQIEKVPYITVGEQVEIIEGPLSGLRGIISAKRRSKVIVSVGAISQSVAVVVAPQFVRSCETLPTQSENVFSEKSA